MFKRVALAAMAAALMIGVGCKSDCEKYVAKAVECAPKDRKIDDDKKKKALEKCEAGADSEQGKEIMACADKGSCDEFRSCVTDVATKLLKERMGK